MKINLLIRNASLTFTSLLDFMLIDKERVFNGRFTLKQDVIGVALIPSIPSFLWKEEEPQDLQERDYLVMSVYLIEFIHSIFKSLNLLQFISNQDFQCNSLFELLQKIDEEHRKQTGQSFNFFFYQQDLTLSGKPYKLYTSAKDMQISVDLILPFIVDERYESVFVSELALSFSPEQTFVKHPRAFIENKEALPYSEDLLIKAIREEIACKLSA